MCVRKLVEAEMTMHEMKVVTLAEETSRGHFYILGTQVRTSRTQIGEVGPYMDQ